MPDWIASNKRGLFAAMSCFSFSISEIFERKRERPAGYIRDIFSHGSLRIQDGQVVAIDLSCSAYQRLVSKYQESTGLGDSVAKAINLLLPKKKPCKPCAKRRARLNRLFPY